MKHAVSNAVFFRRDAVGALGAGPTHFTPRQLEVLALLCEGLPNKLICRRLNIANGTVKVHISCILRELGVASRLQAVVAARSLDLSRNLLPVASQTDAFPGATPLQVARRHEGTASRLSAAA